MALKVNITWLDSVDSTNNEARRLLERFPECDEMSVVAAMEQTAGRGQSGHRWLSEKGKNLTFSILLRYPLRNVGTSDSLRIINTIVCPVILEFLRGEGVCGEVKYPNDILVSGKKICGILIENVISGGEVCASIIGVGFNLNQIQFTAGIPNAVSLACLTGKKYKSEDVLSALVDSFCKKNCIQDF